MGYPCPALHILMGRILSSIPEVGLDKGSIGRVGDAAERLNDDLNRPLLPGSFVSQHVKNTDMFFDATFKLAGSHYTGQQVKTSGLTF